MSKIFLVVVLMISVQRVSAQLPADYFSDRILTVREAIEIAESFNPGIKQLEYQVAAATGEWWTGFGLPSPQLNYSREGMPVDGSGFDEQRWEFNQRLDFPLTSLFRLKRISARRGYLQQKLAGEKRRLKAVVKKSYTDVAYRLRLVDFAREKLIIAEDLFNIAQTRVDAGEASALELLNSEIQFAEAQNDYDRAESDLHRARYRLFAVIGVETEGQQYQVEFGDSLRFFESEISQQVVLGNLQMQPLFLAAHRRVVEAGWQVREAWSGILPDIEAGYFRQDFGRGYDFHGFRVGLSIPLWFFAENQGEIRMARANHHAVQWEKTAVSLQLREEIERAWHDYTASRQSIQRYQSTIRGKAERLLGLTLEGYRIGEIDMLTLMEAQRTYLNSQQKFYLALKTYYEQLIDLERFLDYDLVYLNP